ncbi:MAG: hypothetical protein Q9216_003436 [Gyalolechia sp. 2 TL-2023]
MAQTSRLKESAKETLQEALLFVGYATCYGLSRPVRSYIKNYDTIIPKSIRARRNAQFAKSGQKILPWHKGKHSNNKHTDKDEGSACAEDRTGYLSLPPELRLQILEQTLVTGQVRPYRGQTAHKNWQRDIELVIAAHRQAWKNFILHPRRKTFDVLWEAIESYLTILIGDTPHMCVLALEVAPHFLSVCRAAYEEGHAMFYSHNTFYLPHGPLSHTKEYFDRLRPEHRKLIRKMVLEVTIWDLDIAAFDEIENQLRAKDTVKGRLPPDRSIEDWVAPIAYQLISSWRSKLAWLRDWTWLEEVIISTYVAKPVYIFIMNNPSLSPGHVFQLKGKTLPAFLKGIGPAEPHCPVMDCYRDCDVFFGLWLQCVELYTWTLLQKMIRSFGWKCSKALIRRFAYESNCNSSCER